MVRLRQLTTLTLCFCLLAGLASCKTAQKSEDSTDSVATSTPDDNTMGDSDNGKAQGLQTVHFPYDSFVLDSEAKNVMKANAEIMKAKGNLKVQIEGHCDVRGGIQYNIALGEKRANAVKHYMQDLGIAGARLTTISYGKERLLDQGNTEAAHAKNRRANFAITGN